MALAPDDTALGYIDYSNYAFVASLGPPAAPPLTYSLTNRLRAALLYYDYLLTLPAELAHVWPRARARAPGALWFLANRYVSVLGSGASFVVGWRARSVEVRAAGCVCEGWGKTDLWVCGRSVKSTRWRISCCSRLRSCSSSVRLCPSLGNPCTLTWGTSAAFYPDVRPVRPLAPDSLRARRHRPRTRRRFARAYSIFPLSSAVLIILPSGRSAGRRPHHSSPPAGAATCTCPNPRLLPSSPLTNIGAD